MFKWDKFGNNVTEETLHFKGDCAMKRIYYLLAFTLLMSVFTVCFLIGRAMVIKDDTPATPIENDGVVAIPYGENAVKETASETETVEKFPQANENSDNNDVIEEVVPERMQFPSSEVILRDYSQMAIYSKSTDDWRAHQGIDYKAEKGSDVVSVYDGTVTNIYEDKLWGNCIEIIHTGNILGIYRNLSKDILVKVNEKVSGGQAIGKVGNSASIEKAEEPHLHFELWMNGEVINPSSFIY